MPSLPSGHHQWKCPACLTPPPTPPTPPPPTRPPAKQRILKRSQHTTFATLNCQSLNSAERKNQLTKVLNDLNVQFACLQETRLTNTENQQFMLDVPAPNNTSNQRPSGYAIFAGSADNGYAGCAVAVRKELSPLVQEWGSPCSRIAYVHLKNVKQPTWIISAYAPTRDAEDAVKDEFYAALNSLLDTVPRRHLVILGMDANAQFGADEESTCLGRWYYPASETNDNGHRLLQLAEEYDLCLANTTRRTRREQRITWSSSANLSKESMRTRRTDRLISQIDYVLVSSRCTPMVEKAASVKHSAFPSDHRPVTVRMKQRYIAPKADRRKRHDVQRLLTDRRTKAEYQADVLDRLFPRGRRRGAVTITAEVFTDAISEARNAHVPELKLEKQRPLVSAAAERLVTQLAEARRRKDGREAARAKNALRRRLKQDREQLWQQRVDDIQEAWRSNNSKKVYSLLKRYSGKLKAASDTLESNGRCVAGEQCLDAWRSHFAQLLNRPPPTGDPLRPARAAPYEVEEGPPTADEVAMAIRQLKNGKAAGEDGVQPELLKALPEMAVSALAEVFRSIWDREAIPDKWRTAVVIPLHKKGSTTNPANYRGISLLDVQYKLLERVIVNRLLPEREKRTREEQAGFRPGRSTVDQIFVLRRVLEEHHRYRKPIAVAFLDYACAFDSPDRERIYELLRQDGVPEKLVRVIREMNTDSEAVVRTRSGCSKPFSVATGVRQGAVMGPMLFNYAIDAILREAVKEFRGGITMLPSEKVLTDLDYADDIALISTSLRELQKFIDRVAELAERIGLRLKPPKCELLSTFPDDQQQISVYGEPIQRVPHFCYLGSIIAADGSVKDDIAQRIRKSRAAFATLHRCLWKTNISRQMKLKVYMTAIRPILLYASETWPTTAGEEERLNRAERSFLRQILGYRPADRISNNTLWKEVNAALSPKRLTEVAITVRRNRLKLLGHHLRREPDRLTRVALFYSGDPSWKRPPGGARVTWREAAKRDLDRADVRRIFHGTEAVNKWNSGDWLRVTAVLADNRESWQQFVEKQCGREVNR